MTLPWNEMRSETKSIPNMLYSDLVHVFRIKREHTAAANVCSLVVDFLLFFLCVSLSLLDTIKSLFSSDFRVLGCLNFQFERIKLFAVFKLI